MSWRLRDVRIGRHCALPETQWARRSHGEPTQRATMKLGTTTFCRLLAPGKRRRDRQDHLGFASEDVPGRAVRRLQVAAVDEFPRQAELLKRVAHANRVVEV